MLEARDGPSEPQLGAEEGGSGVGSSRRSPSSDPVPQKFLLFWFSLEHFLSECAATVPLQVRRGSRTGPVDSTPERTAKKIPKECV